MNDNTIERTNAALVETADDVTGHWISMFLYQEARRQAAIAEARATADAMAAIVQKYYP